MVKQVLKIFKVKVNIIYEWYFTCRNLSKFFCCVCNWEKL